MPAILNNMKAALGGSFQGASPTEALAAMQTNPDMQQAVGAYMPQHLRQNLFLPEGGSPGFLGHHPGLSQTLENIIIGQASMNQVPETTGQGISMVANSLMAGPMAHRQFQMQQLMMPFQIAQQLGSIHKEQSEANMNNAKADYFREHGQYYDRGAGAGVTNQTRTNINMSPQIATDGKMYSPDADLPPGVKFVPKPTKENLPYGNSEWGRLLAGMEGKLPEQSPELMTEQERQISQSQYKNARDMEIKRAGDSAAARNFAPGAVSPEDAAMASIVKNVTDQRVSALQKQIEDLNDPKKAFSMVPAGVQDSQGWIKQQQTGLQQQITQVQGQAMQAYHNHQWGPYVNDAEDAVRKGTFYQNMPGVVAPSMGGPTSSAAPGAPGVVAPNMGAPNLSPGAAAYMSNWNK